MTGAGPSPLARAVERWVAIYTRGLPTEVRDARRAELRSDLFEHLRQAAGGGGGGTMATAAGLLVRLGGEPRRRPRRAAHHLFSASPLRGAVALLVLFVVLAVLRMRLVGPIGNEAALMFGVAPVGAEPGRLGRLWGGLLASFLLLVGVKAYAAWQSPLRDRAALVYLAISLASIGILVTVLMLLTEYARRWRRQRRARSGRSPSP